MSNNNQDISRKVLGQIKQGNVKMKPKAYFIALSAISSLVVILAGLATAYTTSIIFYWIKVETASTPAYGARRNLSEAISSFPWWAVIIAALLVIVAVVLMRKQGHLYRHKTAKIALVMVTISILLGMLFYSLGIGSHGSGTKQDNYRSGRGNQTQK